MIKKIIRVINTDRGYVKEHEYSQGYSSFSTTNDLLKAIDLNNYKYNAEFTEKCMFGQHTNVNPRIETYELTIIPC